MPYTIQDSNSLWQFSHNDNRCGGPHSLVAGGTTLLSMLCCSINGVQDSNLRSKSSRLYHKAGQSIFESKGIYPCGVTLAQTCRYSGNTVRITWDMNWPKGLRPTQPVSVGSAVLAGKWLDMTIINRQGKSTTAQIQPGTTLIPSDMLSLILTRDDGTKFEYSLAFDLWRWDYGMGQPVSAPLSLEVSENSLEIKHIICDPTPEEVFPEAREYRFMAVISFSTPTMTAPQIPDATKLAFLPKQAHLDLGNVSSQVISFNLQEMPVVDNARRLSANGRHGVCLEDGHSLTAVKHCIRQIAGYASEGTLVIEGLEPGLCLDGGHCEKKKERQHCDLYSILTFIAWAKNCLGQGWTILVPQQAPWSELPSLAYLSLPLDFEY